MPTQSRYGFADSCLNDHKIEMFCEFISWVVKKKTKTKKNLPLWVCILKVN